MKNSDVFVVNVVRYDLFKFYNIGVYLEKAEALKSFKHARSTTVARIMHKKGLTDTKQLPMSTFGQNINKKSTLMDSEGTPLAAISLTKKTIDDNLVKVRSYKKAVNTKVAKAAEPVQKASAKPAKLSPDHTFAEELGGGVPANDLPF